MESSSEDEVEPTNLKPLVDVNKLITVLVHQGEGESRLPRSQLGAYHTEQALPGLEGEHPCPLRVCSGSAGEGEEGMMGARRTVPFMGGNYRKKQRKRGNKRAPRRVRKHDMTARGTPRTEQRESR